MRRVGPARRIGSFARRFAACAKADGSLTARLFAWRISLPILKRVVPIATLARVMWTTPTLATDERQRLERVAVLTQFVNTGGWVLVSTNCLERSLVLYRLLSEADANPTLVIGGKTVGASLAAHAWIELNGTAPWEADVDRYFRIVAFGPAGQPRDAAGVHSPA